MQEQTFEKGDDISKRYLENDRIMIVWQGKVQVRIERRDPKTG